MRIWKIIKNIILILLALIIFAGGVMYYTISQIPLRAEKNYATIHVMPEDKVDYTVFLYPYGQYERFFEVNDFVRYRIAAYMKINDLVLQEGEQTFCALRNATFKELIKQDFKFEKNTK